MEYFAQQLVNGVTLGSLYGLIAVGYTMVYGIIGMINFAHGDVFMVSSFIALILIVALGVTSASGAAVIFLTLLIVTVLSMALAALWGWAIEYLAYRPLRGSFRLAPLITTIGMSIVLQNLVQVAQGGEPKSIAPIITSGYELPGFESSFAVMISNIQIAIVLATVVLMSIFSFLINRTSFGRAQRACEQDPGMAALLGVNVGSTISLTFMMGAALAAVAGVIYVLYYGVIDFFIGFLVGIKAFTAAVLGGIGSLPGAMLGGLIIGLVETLWSAYFSVEYKDVAAFSILIVMLVFMPSGLLGKPALEKV